MVLVSCWTSQNLSAEQAHLTENETKAKTNEFRWTQIGVDSIGHASSRHGDAYEVKQNMDVNYRL